MKEPRKPAIIFSVRQAVYSDADNRQNHQNAGEALTEAGIDYRSLLGCDRGQCEEVFLVKDTLANSRKVLSLAWGAHQGSILYLDADHNARLFFLNVSTFHTIGVFREVSKKVALQSESWTFDPEREIFYVAD